MYGGRSDFCGSLASQPLEPRGVGDDQAHTLGSRVFGRAFTGGEEVEAES